MDWLKYAIDYGIIGLLLVMSFLAVSIGVERYLLLKKVRIEDYTDKKSLELELTHKIHLIATIGSSAPYIGLLGTVLCIMLTFYSMG
jgi:biopolymer transport protein ExbB